MFILNRNHLASLLEMPIKNLTHLLYHKNAENCYTSFNIPKKNGNARLISVPNKELKEIQHKLADIIYKKQQKIWEVKKISPNISHGFEKKKSIITNAKIHRNKKLVLNIDLENFFSSVHFGRVRGYFANNKEFMLPLDTATILAQLTCYKGSLPQGAPTSPVITNLICQILDFKLLHIAKKYKLDYTRYADDLTFSTNHRGFVLDEPNFLKEITKAIEKSGFKINKNKTRLQYQDSQQKVTGLIVNRKVNVDSNYFRTTKAMAHSLYTTGEFLINGEKGSINQLEGRFNFINQIDKNDNISSKEKIRNAFSLNGREREYQRFLFYKHFYCCNKPTIVTEGKTDILYIKAALKKYVSKYPLLIKKNSNGTFDYNIVFLKKTPKLKYFFGIAKDGADTLNRIYQNYTEKGNCTNCLKKLIHYNASSHYPVMLIFDNEIERKVDAPIKKFQGFKSLSEEKKTLLKSNLYIELMNNANIYLVINPLVAGKHECEIEDLFSKETLSIEIDGRKFSRKGEKGTYGKEVFANYVYNNYYKIDFSNFIPFLDAIRNVVEAYINKKTENYKL